MLLLASCSNDDFADDIALSSPQSLTASGSVLNEVQGTTSSILTRASNDKWEDGDAIGVSGCYADGATWFTNGKFSRRPSGSFMSATPYLYKDEQTHTLTAYYPYNASVTAVNPFLPITPYLTETADGTTAVGSKQACDYMFATGTATKGSMPKLTFKHVNTKVFIILYTGNGVSTRDLKTATVSLTASFSGSFNTQTGEVSVDEKTTYPIACAGAKIYNGMDYDFYLPPQKTAGVVLTISFTDGTKISADLSKGGVTEWAGGYYYQYIAECSRRNISTTSTQSDISDITQ